MSGNSRICLTLVGRTVAEDVALAAKYRGLADMVELRLDALDPGECANAASFVESAGIPAILTARRVADGGAFDEGREGERRALLARLAPRFQYVDFECDLEAPELVRTARSAGTRIVRSLHRFAPDAPRDAASLDSLCRSPDEIPKLAFMPRSAADVAALHSACASLPPRERIFCAMGRFGAATRVMPFAFGSFLSFASAPESAGSMAGIGHIDIETMHSVYAFRSLSRNTRVCCVTGWPLDVTASPQVHRDFCRRDGVDSVMLPVPGEDVRDAMALCEALGARGLAVTVPHKKSVMPLLDWISPEAAAVGAVNTVIWRDGRRLGFNTDIEGFSKAILSFGGCASLRGARVAIIGSGGAARAVAFALARLGADAAIYARNARQAGEIAAMSGMPHFPLGDIASSGPFDLMVQCTSVGNGSSDPADDPIPEYRFAGTEMVYDLIYKPWRTPLLARAESAGCRVGNGMSMLVAQGEAQHRLFHQGVLPCHRATERT